MLLKIKPTKISIYTANGKLTCAQVRKKTGCDICINGTLYNMKTYAPVCDVKIDGKVLSDDQYKYLGYGWNKGEHRAVVSTEMTKWDNYISCIMMINNGSAIDMYYSKDVGGKRGRTAFGYKADGTMVIYCYKDSSSGACTPEQLQSKMLSYGCVDAICLDGGGSSQIDSDFGKVTSSRKVANYICIWTNDCPYSEPTKTIKKNSCGSGAKWVQWHLNKVDNASLAVDGIFGKGSLAALKKFQESNNLKPDGLCGPSTRAALKKLLKG